MSRKVQSLTSIKLSNRDYNYFTDWLLRVGVGTVKSAMENIQN